MNPMPTKLLLLTALATGSGLTLYTFGPQTEHGAEPTASAAPATAPLPEDRAVDAGRRTLLDLAFDAASAMPVKGHGKDRSRRQHEVVKACLELDLPQTALRYADGIADWQRGEAYADYAYYCVEQGAAAAAVEPFLKRAKEIAETDSLAQAQEWRRDRVLVRIASTRALLGDTAAGRDLPTDATDSEAGKLELVFAERVQAEDLQAYVADMDGILEAGNLDQVCNTLEICARLHDRFYGDAERREMLAERVRTGYAKLPLGIRIDLLEKLTMNALGHQDPAGASALVDSIAELVESGMWSAEYRVPLLARVARLRALTGQPELARETAAKARRVFDADRDSIVGIFRCEALLPLGAAYQAMGEPQQALEVYGMAVEEGAANPNGRCRAMDLSAACRSMALEDAQPDEALLARLKEILGGLEAPW